MATRVDAGGAFSFKRTPQGGIDVSGAVTRTGVFPYRRADGSVVMELRHPDDVLREDSLDTLRGAPVTIDHPRGAVVPENWKALSVGHVSDHVEGRADGFVMTRVRVQDAAAAAKVGSELREFSCGYSCDVVPEVGIYNGQRYDARQTNIVYNHVAMGPEGWGRLGPEVSIRADAADAYTIDMFRTDGADAPKTDKQDGASEASKDAARADAAEARADAAVAKADALAKENADLKAEIDRLKADASDEKIAARADARAALVEGAKLLAGDKFSAKDDKGAFKSDHDLRLDALKVACPGVDFTAKSATYVEVRFDSEVERARETHKAHGDLRAALSAPKTDSASSDALAKAEEEDKKRRASAFKPAGYKEGS